MPYITKEDRDRLNVQLAIITGKIETPGQLNYAITQLARGYIMHHDPYSQFGPNYSRINEVMGALECAKLEFYRRAAAPYEDQKIAENGDVY